MRSVVETDTCCWVDIVTFNHLPTSRLPDAGAFDQNDETVKGATTETKGYAVPLHLSLRGEEAEGAECEHRVHSVGHSRSFHEMPRRNR
jgi:hypothetical protein